MGGVASPEAGPPLPGAPEARPLPTGMRRWFHKWLPVLTLMFLAALLPELLTGSTPVPLLITTPPGILSLLALYGCGALLIREASVRWRKGWAAVLPLGAAYGLIEEGLFAKTLIDPAQPQVGILGIYGRWLGLNWILVAAFLLFHALFSIALQILLTDLIFSRTKGRPFLGPVGTTLALAAFVFNVVVGFFVNDPTHYMPDLPVLVALLAAIGLLVLLAYRVPARYLWPWREIPDRSPRWFQVEGVLFMVCFFALFILGTAFVPVPAVVFALYIGLAGLTARFVLAHGGRRGNEAHKLGFAAGLILFFIPFDIILEIQGDLGVVVVPALLLVLIYRLHRMWRSANAPPSPLVPFER